ncbi:kyphoscoliosis peptidase-like [Mercenaria mercenaria]|uniref:kyphoscoliosis peptidase-like n=1 Tax=Mercenaria mercenaria TaxID=6596 RepID=UPI00234F3218|nr:kyphoscoliosis peptidase-like [Mercenaria mercenaria]
MGCSASQPETVSRKQNNINSDEKVSKMRCPSPKTDTENVPVTVVNKNQSVTMASVKRSHSNLKETYNYQKIDQHAREVSKMRCPSPKTDTENVPVTVVNKNQSVTMASVKRSHSNLKETYNYQKIDQHARKAPNSVKNSAEELVKYMSTVSKDPRMLARGFFVWSSENIKYDVEGFFGRATKAPNDAESVMKNGRSVCEGYASVFELLCRKAGIPVKKISGFSKGYGYSAAKPLTLSTSTDHAWNAVQLEGKWYLLDSTWGAGHLDSETNSFKKKFDDFYFLTDPKQFVSAHFPYMDNNLEESQKWQLLPKPLSLEEFNKNVEYKPEAFRLGVLAISHPQAYFEMKNEVEMTFKSKGKEEITITARLMLKEGNWLKEQRNTTFEYLEKGANKLLVHPKSPGTYQLTIFGKLVSDDNNEKIPEIMEYIIKCTEVKDKDHEYPVAFGAASTERCILHEPLRGNLPANTQVQFRVSAPHLQHVMVEHTYLEKSGTMFTGNVTTHAPGYQVSMYGTRGEKHGRLDGLYKFHTV